MAGDLFLTSLKAHGYGIIAITAIQLLAAAFLKAHLSQATYKIAVVVRAALTQAVYRKSLNLHISAVEASTGAATSHIEIDVQRLTASPAVIKSGPNADSIESMQA